MFLPVLAGREVLATFLAIDDDNNWRFGVIESYEAPDKAAELNVGWTRVRFHWAETQVDGPDDWSPRLTDEQIDSEISAGRLVVGLLIGTPDWARGEDQLPKGLWLAHDDPGNTWANFVRLIVNRYAGRIDHWIIWNEPDIREEAVAHAWDGSVADFAQLQRVAYRAAKESNPDAVIHLSAFTYWADYYAGTEQYMARLLDEIMTEELAAQYNYYFDVATAHLYFQPAQIYDLLELFKGIMEERAMTQPIWLVETNAPPRNDWFWPVRDWTLSVTLDEQASFIPQALASALAAGAERVAIYKLKDTEDDTVANPEPFGLLRMNGSPRPAFDTYQVAIQHLEGFNNVERERWDEVGQIRFDQEGQTTTVLFARLPLPQRARVAATDETAVLVDMWGVERKIAARSGEFTVNLPPAYCTQPIGDYCMIGGTTFYLVQSADVPRSTKTLSTTVPMAETRILEPTKGSDVTETVTVAATPMMTSAPPEFNPTATVMPALLPTEAIEATVLPSPQATTVAAAITTPAATRSTISQDTPEGDVDPNFTVLLAGAAVLLLLVIGGAIWYVSNR